MVKRNDHEAYKKRRNGKRGYTLVELAVVLLLIGILTTMIVSFSVLVSKNTHKSTDAYNFSENCSAVRETLVFWTMQTDKPDTRYYVLDDGTLVVDMGGVQSTLVFSDETLSLNDKQLTGLSEIDDISFAMSDALIRCTLSQTDEEGTRREFSFVFAPRVGTVGREEGSSNE